MKLLNWNFLGRMVQNKKPSVGEKRYFLELHNTKGGGGLNLSSQHIKGC